MKACEVAKQLRALAVISRAMRIFMFKKRVQRRALARRRVESYAIYVIIIILYESIHRCEYLSVNYWTVVTSAIGIIISIPLSGFRLTRTV